jgi:phosphatidylinositol 4-kinase
MISLANSILIQRIGKVTSAVHAKIVGGLASLVPISSTSDFKSIFEVFVKTSMDAVWQDDQALSDAVSFQQIFSWI